MAKKGENRRTRHKNRKQGDAAKLAAGRETQARESGRIASIRYVNRGKAA